MPRLRRELLRINHFNFCSRLNLSPKLFFSGLSFNILPPSTKSSFLECPVSRTLIVSVMLPSLFFCSLLSSGIVMYVVIRCSVVKLVNKLENGIVLRLTDHSKVLLDERLSMAIFEFKFCPCARFFATHIIT